MNISQLQLGTVKLLRYIHGGVLLVLAYALLTPETAKLTFNTMGPTFATISLFSIGPIVYLMHRNFFGEVFIYPYIQRKHAQKDEMEKRTTKGDVTCPTSYLEKLGVDKDVSRCAYTFVRRNCFGGKTETLDLAHSELHMLWITAEIIALAYAIILIEKLFPYLFSDFLELSLTQWGFLFILLLIFEGLLVYGTYEAEIKQSSYETHLLRRLVKEPVLKECLENAGFSLQTNCAKDAE